MRAKVSLGLSKRTTPNLIEFARQIVTAMTGNAYFTTPNPTLSNITLAVNNLEATYNNTNMSDKNKSVQVSALRVLLMSSLDQLGAYVDNVANGDAAIVVSAGMNTVAAPVSAPLPPAPQHVSAISSTAEGQASLHWDRVKGAHVYVIEISNDVAAVTPVTTTLPAPSTARSFITWVQADIITKTHYMLSNLTSGIKYAVRVYAVGAKGKGFYSAPVIVKVL